MSAPQVCITAGTDRSAALELNRTCQCWPVDTQALVEQLPAEVRASLAADHAHLFANTGVFLHPDDLRAMQRQIGVAEELLWQRGRQGPRGVLMGYDFHLTDTGPRLIEINTNAGGAFLVQHMTQVLSVKQPVGDAQDCEAALYSMFQKEWQRAGRSGSPQTLAIVDDAPEQQYLYPDMLLAARLLRPLQQGQQQVVIADRAALKLTASGLQVQETVIDMVYNRLTDFALADPESRALRAALAADQVVVSPAPEHHRALADKRNLVLLSDADSQVPATQLVSPTNADALWRERKRLFFKPADGFGGRATYRGAGLTRRVWQEILAGSYVAQELVRAPRRAGLSAASPPLKFDLRVYSYAAQPLMLAARIYSGQTTNFRTWGGGFAPVQLLSESTV